MIRNGLASIIYWKCSQVKCSGRGTSQVDSRSATQLIPPFTMKSSHDLHLPDKTQLGKIKVKESTLALAKNTNDPPRTIISSVRQQASLVTLWTLSRSALNEYIRRIRTAKYKLAGIFKNRLFT